MEALRAGIDEVDEKIVRLLDQRARLARRIGEIKQENGLEAYAPARERAVLDRVASLGRATSRCVASRRSSARSSPAPSRSRRA